MFDIRKDGAKWEEIYFSFTSLRDALQREIDAGTIEVVLHDSDYVEVDLNGDVHPYSANLVDLRIQVERLREQIAELRHELMKK